MNDATRPLRVLTWNIHGCIGRDGRHDVTRIGETVRALAPDIAAFQEVDLRIKSGSETDILGYLRAQVGDHGHEAWAITGADGNYGQILASRFPLIGRTVHDLSVPGREPRRAMEVRIELPSMSLRVIATHLGLRPGERRRQLRQLRDLAAVDPASPLLLLGDFNEWRRGPKIMHVLCDTMAASTMHASFPARFPVLALDRILCRPKTLLARSWTAKEARAASDHLPVVAELALPSSAPA